MRELAQLLNEMLREAMAEAWQRFESKFSMNDIKQMLESQARWQKSRQSLSWPEKIRIPATHSGPTRIARAIVRNPFDGGKVISA